MQNEKIKTPNNGATTSEKNFNTKTIPFQQKFENLPIELTEQPRFFKVGADKKPLIADWSNTDKQDYYQQINGIAGFDCSGHYLGDDYIFLDFDHILNEDGTFINETAKEFVSWILDALGGYCELSISHTGLHMFAVPSIEYAADLSPMAGGRKASLYFTDKRGKDCPKLEIFYRTKGRYCLLTGDIYACAAQTPITNGEIADDVIKSILLKIEGQLEQRNTQSKKDSDIQSKSMSKKTDLRNFSNPSDYDSARAMAMINCIDVSQLNTDSEWLSFMTACKNLNISYSIVDTKNAQDATRCNEKENLARWQSLNDSSFDIETLHGLAKRFGYSEKEFYQQWHRNNHTDNKENSNLKTHSNKLTKEEKFSLFSLPHTDLYNARRISIFHGKNIRYLADSHKWYTYQKNIWIDGGKENSAILPFANKLAFTIEENADTSVVTDEILARKWQKRKTFSNAIELLKGVDSIRITEKDLNTHKHLLNCANGIVDLQTGKLYQHDSKYLITQCIKVEYHVDFKDETVDKFLHEVLPDEETLQALLRFLGYSLTGEISEEKALFIHGRGGNGKGTLTKMLLALFNNYGCSFPIESILMQPLSKDADSATPAFNKLQWCRLAIAEEIPAGRKLDYAKFKILTGGDALPIRKLYQESSEITDPVHKMIFSGNHLPTLDDAHDPGILRRWIQIKFEQDFTGNNCDETLKKKLQTNYALTALLSLLIKNSVEWYKNGLIVSEKMKRDRDSYFAENDFVSEFISEFCERGKNFSVSRKEFLKHLQEEYPKETRGKSDRELTSTIIKIEGITYKRSTGGGYKFFGVRLRDSQSQETLGDDFIIPPDF